MATKAVLFDRDGVLTTFDVPAATAFFQRLVPVSLVEISMRWQSWGARVGFPRNVTEEKIFFHGFWDALSDEFNLAMDLRQQLHRFEYTRYVRPFPEVRSILLAVRRRGLGIGVLSNFSLASLEESLVAVNLADVVDVACAATVIGAAKPAPEAYLIASHRLGVQPEECLFFDDELVCVEGGRAVGMHAYLVDRRRHDHALPQGVVCNLTGILEILG